MNGRKGMVLILSGPSGSGKSTIYRAAFERVSGFEFSISCTTRSPRPGELDGKDYFFIDKSRFEALISEDAFAEYAEVHGNYYGTLKSELYERTKRGIDVLLDIDVQGAMRIKDLCRRDPQFAASCEFVFVMPPSFEELERRLRGRGTETEEVLLKRLKNARTEAGYLREYDYLLINDELDKALEGFLSLIRAFRMANKRLPAEQFPFQS